MEDELDRICCGKTFAVVLVPIGLLTLAATSAINRNFGYTEIYHATVIHSPHHGANISTTTVSVDEKEVTVSVQRAGQRLLSKGDTLEIEKITGLLGFELINKTTIANKN